MLSLQTRNGIALVSRIMQSIIWILLVILNGGSLIAVTHGLRSLSDITLPVSESS